MRGGGRSWRIGGGSDVTQVVLGEVYELFRRQGTLLSRHRIHAIGQRWHCCRRKSVTTSRLFDGLACLGQSGP